MINKHEDFVVYFCVSLCLLACLHVCDQICLICLVSFGRCVCVLHAVTKVSFKD